MVFFTIFGNGKFILPNVLIETFFSFEPYVFRVQQGFVNNLCVRTMKRMRPLLILFALMLVGFQSTGLQARAATTLEFVDPPQSTILEATTEEVDIVSYLFVKNTGTTSKKLRVRREIIQLAPNHESIFCFGGMCLDGSNDLSVVSELGAGATTSYVNALNPKLENIYNNPGTSKIKYTVFDVDNPDDNISIELTYVVKLPTDVHMPFDFAPVTILANAFPSPATDVAHIDYNIAQSFNNASITVYNLIGNPLYTFPVDMPKGRAELQVSSMTPGVYFYSIVADGKKLATKKLVIKR